jgi:hypothetical protein
MLQPTAKWLIHKVERKCQHYVIQSDRPNQPPTPRPKDLVQTTKRKKCNSIGPQCGDSKENEYPDSWYLAYATQPSDKAKMNKMSGSKRETK